MKTRRMLALLVTVALIMLTACGASTETTDDGAVINKEYSEKTMTTVTGAEVDVANTSFALGATAYGYAMVYPQSWKDIPAMNLYLARDENICVASYVPQAVVEQLVALADSEMSEEETAQANALLGESLIPFAALVAVDESDGKQPAVLADYHQADAVATANGYQYMLAYNTDFAVEDLDETDQANLDILAKSVTTMKENVVLFPPQTAQASGFAGSLEEFSAKDMSGKTVDQRIFADYDLTMVNIWATWCGYCIEEMDELETLYEKLPENVNMLTVCADASEEKALAEEILSKNGATFQTLVGNDSLHDTLLQHVSGYPTTIFVDKTGKVVGDIQQGAPGRDVLAGYQTLIDDRLALLDNDGGDTAWLKEKE